MDSPGFHILITLTEYPPITTTKSWHHEFRWILVSFFHGGFGESSYATKLKYVNRLLVLGMLSRQSYIFSSIFIPRNSMSVFFMECARDVIFTHTRMHMRMHAPNTQGVSLVNRGLLNQFQIFGHVWIVTHLCNYVLQLLTLLPQHQ